MLTDAAARAVFPGSERPADGDGAGAGALALQHQHVPELGPRASVPLPRAQRRDQHAARQHQLDARARGAVPDATRSATTCARSCRSSIRTARDSAMFDNTLELLVLAGRSLPHAMMMMIPEPWSNHQSMDDAKRAFYQYHSCLMEPWDGPASIAFTDGKQIGAVLDRNGLRPSRYYVTKDGLVVMASEAGVLDIPAENVLHEGPAAARPHVPRRHRAGPHHRGRGDQARDRRRAPVPPVAQRAPGSPQRSAGRAARCRQPDHDTLLQRQIAFGYTFEDERLILAPMAQNGVEAVGSMGNDTPLAVLSNKPRLLYDYFKQLFAQVTNPPIDCIREEIITSAETRLGSEGNLLNPQPADCRRLEVKWPILTNEEFAKVRRMDLPGLQRRRAADAVPRHARREGPGQVDGRDPPHGAAHDRGRGSERPHPQRSRRESRVRADPGAARGRGPASLSDPRRPAHARQPRARDRRGARGASLRAADRLRRQRDQSVRRVRDDRRHDPRRAPARTSITRRPARTSSRPRPRA